MTIPRFMQDLLALLVLMQGVHLAVHHVQRNLVMTACYNLPMHPPETLDPLKNALMDSTKDLVRGAGMLKIRAQTIDIESSTT